MLDQLPEGKVGKEIGGASDCVLKAAWLELELEIGLGLSSKILDFQ